MAVLRLSSGAECAPGCAADVAKRHCHFHGGACAPGVGEGAQAGGPEVEPGPQELLKSPGALSLSAPICRPRWDSFAHSALPAVIVLNCFPETVNRITHPASGKLQPKSGPVPALTGPASSGGFLRFQVAGKNQKNDSFMTVKMMSNANFVSINKVLLQHKSAHSFTCPLGSFQLQGRSQ